MTYHRFDLRPVSGIQKEYPVSDPDHYRRRNRHCGFTYAIEYLLDKHTFVTCMAFVGLILGGLPAIFSSMRAKVSSGGVGVFGILAFVIAFAISGGMPL